MAGLRFQRDLLLPAFVLAGEFAWLGLWLKLFFSRAGGETILSYPALFLAGLGGALLMRVGRAKNVPLGTLRALAVAGAVGIPAITVSLDYGLGWISLLPEVAAHPIAYHPDPILGLAVAAIAWWRGLVAGDSALETLAVEGRFRAGLAGLIAVALLAPVPLISRFAAATVTLVPLHALAFFVFMLTALALCRARTLASYGVVGSAMASRWTNLLLFMLGGLVLLGVVAAAFLPAVTPLSETFFSALASVLRWLGPVFEIIILPFAWLAEILTIALSWLIRLITGGQVQEPMQNPADIGFDRPPPEPLNDSAIQTIQWILATIALAMAVYYLARSIRQRRASRADELDEVRDTVWSWQEWLAGVRAYFAGRFRKPAPLAAAEASRRQVEETEEAKTIREMYRQFLLRCASIGNPRRPGQTPAEFLASSAVAFEHGADAAGQLTDAYVQARYGPEPVTEDLVAKARQAWTALGPVLQTPSANATEPR